MVWTHKNINIEIDPDGRFYFSHKGKNCSADTLNDARKKIDELTEKYYDFTEDDKNKLLKKLNEREQDFVNQLIEELEVHRNNPYCEIGISKDMLFNF